MWWYGRGNSGGSWLLEEKKLIYGPEGEIVVAHGRLPSHAHQVHTDKYIKVKYDESLRSKIMYFPYQILSNITN